MILRRMGAMFNIGSFLFATWLVYVNSQSSAERHTILTSLLCFAVIGSAISYILIAFSHSQPTEDANYSNLVSIKDSLQKIRRICSDALDRKEAINTESAQQWVRQLQIYIEDAQLRLEGVIRTKKPQT